jgi:hypothetical protein
LNQFGIFLQNSQKKNRKEKEKRKGKRKKGPREMIWPRNQNRPTAHLFLSPEAVRSPSFFLADTWDPLVSTDISFNLRPRFSPGDSAITPSKSDGVKVPDLSMRR